MLQLLLSSVVQSQGRFSFSAFWTEDAQGAGKGQNQDSWPNWPKGYSTPYSSFWTVKMEGVCLGQRCCSGGGWVLLITCFVYIYYNYYYFSSPLFVFLNSFHLNPWVLLCFFFSFPSSGKMLRHSNVFQNTGSRRSQVEALSSKIHETTGKLPVILELIHQTSKQP